MKRQLFPVLIFLLVSLLGFQQSPQQTARNFSIQKLSDGVWAVIHNDKGGHAICNAGIVDLGDKTLVFDAFINPGAALELKQAAEKLTHHKVAYVVNSHYHDDHIRVPGFLFPALLLSAPNGQRTKYNNQNRKNRTGQKKIMPASYQKQSSNCRQPPGRIKKRR